MRLLALLLLLLEASPAPPLSEASSSPAASAEPPASPTPTDERLQRVRARKATLERDLAAMRGQEKSLLGEVEQLELEVRLRGEQLRETQLVLQRAQQEMETATKHLAGVQADVERTRPQLAARARQLYKLGELSYLRMLLSVERPADILRGYRAVTALARRDRLRMAAFRGNLALVTRTQQDLQRRTAEAQALRGDLDRMRQRLDADRRRKTALLTSLVQKKEVQAAYLQELLEAEQRLSGLFSGLSEGEASVPVGAFKGTLSWPVPGKVRTAFGRQKHPRFDTYTLQNGIDIAAAADAPVSAVHEGRVAFADQFRGYGLMVVIDHGGKHHSLYAHLAEARVTVGQRIGTGDTVGTVGSSGLLGPGLYFEMRAQGKPQDPTEWLKPEPGRMAVQK